MWLTYIMAFLTGLLAFHAFEEGGPLTIASGVLALLGSVWIAWYAYTWPRRKSDQTFWPRSSLVAVLPLVPFGFGILQRLAEHFEHGPPPTRFEVGTVSVFLICGLTTVWFLWKGKTTRRSRKL